MGYIRIEPLPGGARLLAMPELDSGAIDKDSDGRGELTAQRMENETERRRRGKPPIPKQTKKMKKNERNGWFGTEFVI